MALLHTLLLPLAFLAGTLTGDGWLGIKLADADRPTVEDVIPDSPAAKAKLRNGDVIVSVNDKKTSTVDALFEVFEGLDAGDWIRLSIERGGKSMEMKIQLAARPVEGRSAGAAETKRADKPAKKSEVPAPVAEARDPAKQPAKAAPQPAFLGVELEEAEGGMVVTDLIAGAPAMRSGVRRGDLIRSVDSKAVRTVEQLDRVMQGLHANDRIKLVIQRRNEELVIEVVAGVRPGAKPKEPAEKAPPKREPAKKDPAKKDAAEQPRKSEGKSRKPAAGKARTEAPAALAFGSSLPKARESARKSGRPMIVVFGAGWCPHCEALKKSLHHSSLQAALDRYERVWIDVDRQSALADEFKVEDLPHTILFSAAGEPQKTIRGYQPPQILLPMLRAGLATAKSGDRGDAPREDRPKSTKPKTDKPKSAKPKSDTPKSAKPKSDTPKTDRPKSTKPKTDKPKSTKPKPDRPQGEQPKSSKSKKDEPRADKSDADPRRDRRPAADAPQRAARAQIEEVRRLRAEIQKLREEQRRQEELLKRILQELQKKRES